ncbi:hypothetical protein O0I10_005444 [Lichtheimia ornata]|uniref:Uncharacterized protein n=1 Tax=Lichtheimia ornata TaxID=688661 RepID=A0AAD7V4L6_9FUNG|nr:uncharacterized protein O0I10_005444 [Lichtheimia ornata]KAJ8658720.1 hypothetical protein O0I10_005444 [Lichtheimia ornata]
MLRRFGFSRATSLEAILAKPNARLEELLDNEDLLQEVHLQNTKLITFLRQPAILSQLVNYIVSERITSSSSSSSSSSSPGQQQAPASVQKKLNVNGDINSTYMALSCEILGAGVPALMDGLVYAHPELLTMLWALLDQQHQLAPRQLAGFCKVNAVLLQRRTSDLVHFIQTHNDIVAKWLHHIFIHGGGGMPYLSDLLAALIQCEGSPEGAGIAQWLADHGLLTLLVDRLQPQLDPVNHEIAQQLLCDIIYLSPSPQTRNPLIDELTSSVTMKRMANYMLDSSADNASSSLQCCTTIIRGLRQYSERVLPDLLQNPEKLLSHSSMFHPMLDTFINHMEGLMLVLKIEPKEPMVFGLKRLAVCELLVELLYFISIVNGDKGLDLLQRFGDAMVEQHAIPKCLDLFFAFPYNNVLHNSVYGMLREILTCESRVPREGPGPDLVKEVLETGRLVERILKAQEKNDESVKKRGRLGYMGHLALMSNDVQYVLQERDPKLPEQLFVDTPGLADRWSQHMDQLHEQSINQMTYQGETVFWSGRYQFTTTLDDTTTTRIYDTTDT